MEQNEVKIETPQVQSSAKNQWILPVLAGGLALSLGMNFWQSTRFDAVNGQLGQVTQQVAEVKKSLGAMEQGVAASVSGMKQEVAGMQDEAKKIAATTARGASQAAQSLAQRHADRLVKNLEKNQEETRQQLAEQLNQGISQVKAATDEQSSKIANVSTDVTNVKSEVATTRTELQQTISDLRRATGDMGVMSGLIATNSGELKALKEMGERNYFEFRIRKNDKVQRVGDVLLSVKRTDTKRNRFSLELTADDRRIEKKDKTLNEPIQFYVSPNKARTPYEIVVYGIEKDTIVGYLATPKMQMARN